MGSDSTAGGPQADFLVRNSLLLMGSTVLAAGLGFLFWVLAARVFTPEEVGIGASLSAALTFISHIAMGGLNNTLIRFLTTGQQRNQQVTQSLTFVALVGGVVGCGYALTAPLVVADLETLRANIGAVVLFTFASAVFSVGVLLDSVYIALRRTEYNFWITGWWLSAAKILFLFVFGWLSSMGILAGLAAGYAVACISGAWVLRYRLGLRIDLGRRLAFSRDRLLYSGSNYLASGLTMAPTLLVPLIIMSSKGADSSAFFFAAFQIASIVYAFSLAVGEVNLAEASRDPARHHELMRRSGILMLLVVIPIAGLLCLFGPWLLAAFGQDYADQAGRLLFVLAVASLPVGFNLWVSFLLRITRQKVALVVTCALYATLIIGLTAAWGSQPLEWVGYAWIAGNLGAGILGLIVLERNLPIDHGAGLSYESGVDNYREAGR